MNKYIAVSIGDINGLGIELLLKSWKSNKIKNFVLFTDVLLFKKYLRKRNIKIKINIINESNKYIFDKRDLNIYSFKSVSNIDNTLKSIQYCYYETKKNNFIGIVTLPLRKDLIKKLHYDFIGHTEFLQKLNKKKYSNMILYNKKIMVSPLTTHISIKNVSKKIKNKNLIFNQIYNLNKTLINDFGIKKPKLIISGLNPHSGDKGAIGNEEINLIIPVLKKIRKEGVYIHGPFSADSMINKNNLVNYDCFIFIYHDQALIPFKYISNFSGVNYTGNLDIIRTSPDHGTAYNLIGSNLAKNKSLINCFKLIKSIHNNRISNDKAKKITGSKFY